MGDLILEKQVLEENLDEAAKNTNSSARIDILSSLKSLPKATVSHVQKLRKFSSSKITAIDENLRTPAKSTSTTGAEEDGYIPLKHRLAAWWHGDDIKISTENSKKTNQNTIEVSAETNSRRWSTGSIAMVQKLWGEGFAEPGGAAFVKKSLSLMKFESSNTILDLSAGLGGTACNLAKEHNLWMDAYEPDDALAAAGIKFASRHGMSKKVPIKHVDFETLELPKSKYDQIYSRESLFMVENKKNVIKQIGKSLKHKGQVLIVDYMLSENCNRANVEKWIESEPERPHPWTADLYHTALDHFGISVWTTNDLSEEYSRYIHDGWLLMVDNISNGNFDRSTIDSLMREGEIWLNRSRALESGDLTIKRIHGVV